MNLTPKTITLKNNQPYHLRSPQPQDAAALLAYIKKVMGETYFLNYYPDEFNLTAAQEVDFINSLLVSKTNMMITVFYGGQIIASAHFAAKGRLDKLKHRAEMAISVVRSHWRVGLGSALMQVLIDEVRAAGYRQLELTVYADNQRAIGLYQKFGFELWGRVPSGFILRDGKQIDEVLMGLIL